jgi:hypothetical protein
VPFVAAALCLLLDLAGDAFLGRLARLQTPARQLPLVAIVEDEQHTVLRVTTPLAETGRVGFTPRLYARFVIGSLVCCP